MLTGSHGQLYSNQNLHLLTGYKDLEPSASGDHHTIPEFSLIKGKQRNHYSGRVFLLIRSSPHAPVSMDTASVHCGGWWPHQRDSWCAKLPRRESTHACWGLEPVLRADPDLTNRCQQHTAKSPGNAGSDEAGGGFSLSCSFLNQNLPLKRYNYSYPAKSPCSKDTGREKY